MPALPLRSSVALAAALLAGLVLHLGGLAGVLVADPGADAPGHPAAAATVDAAVDTSTAGVVSNRTSTSAWRLTLPRATTVLAGLLALAAVLTTPRRSPAPAWRLVRPDRVLATTRHSSPLAARRAPPAPAGR